MKKFSINESSIFEIDSILEGQDLTKYELEIEKIVENLWAGIGEYEEILKPFFVVFLKNDLLPSLYINYLALDKLNKKYEQITITASTSIIDNIGKKLNFKLEPNRKNFDYAFKLTRSYFFTKNLNSSKNFWIEMLRKLKGRAIYYWSILRGVDVLYLNAGKLKNDFSLIPKALNAMYIPVTNPKQSLPDTKEIQNIIIKNINSMNLSIPPDLIIEILNKNIFNNLIPMFKRILLISEFIQKYKVKLVISSSPINEIFISLIASSKIANIDSLIISHGMPTVYNPYLNDYITYQGVINNFDPIYSGAKVIKFKASWFE